VKTETCSLSVGLAGLAELHELDRRAIDNDHRHADTDRRLDRRRQDRQAPRGQFVVEVVDYEGQVRGPLDEPHWRSLALLSAQGAPVSRRRAREPAWIPVDPSERS